MTADTTPESPEYTPSMDEIREYVMVGDPKPWEELTPEVDAREQRRGEAFDRALAAHDAEVARKVAEKAWDEGHFASDSQHGAHGYSWVRVPNPYRAEQIGENRGRD